VVADADDGSLMLLQTRASMKLAVDNATEEVAAVQVNSNESEAAAQTHAEATADVKDESSIAMTAPLTEEGYSQVLALQNSTEMGKYVVRVGEDLDIAVSNTGRRALVGFVPWFSGEKANESASYLNSMTKAYFKDGNSDHALKFFEEGIQSRRKMKEDQDEALVKLFDATFAEECDKPYDIQAFKERYLNLMIVREKMKKEVKKETLAKQRQKRRHAIKK